MTRGRKVIAESGLFGVPLQNYRIKNEYFTWEIQYFGWENEYFTWEFQYFGWEIQYFTGEHSPANPVKSRASEHLNSVIDINRY